MENHPHNLYLSSLLNPLKEHCLKGNLFWCFFQLSVAMVNYFLIKFCYALNTKEFTKAPSHSWKRERRGGDGLFFPTLQEEEEEGSLSNS